MSERPRALSIFDISISRMLLEGVMTPRFQMAAGSLYFTNELLLLASLALLALLIYAVHPVGWPFSQKSKQHFPPGPPPRFLVGNWFDFPQRDDASQYMEWEKKYHSALMQTLRILLNLKIHR